MQKHILPKLPYAFGALEPYMDAKTVEIHWGKHHQGYVDKLNLALEKHPKLFERSVEELLADLNSIPEDIRTAVRNFGGGHANHSLFWSCMAPKAGGEPSGKTLDAIKKNFGSFEEFKKQFSDKAMTLFGSGYAWLVSNGDKLEIMTTKDQDSPLSIGKKPLLVIDLWEHSYYLKFQNRRNEYVGAWWNLVNWEMVERNYENA